MMHKIYNEDDLLLPTENVAVIGSGLMGHGIALVAAMAGQKVVLIDTSVRALENAQQRIADGLDRMALKGRLAEPAEKILPRIRSSRNIKVGVRGAGLVFEAVPEDLALKRRIVKAVEAAAPQTAILATNTSGLSINAIAAVLDHPGRFIGMHWMNPAPRMPVVEIIPGRHTHDDTTRRAMSICARYGKQPILCRRDVWYFLASRARSGLSFEANRLYLDGRAGVAEIDAALRHQLQLPMGEFELMDLTGAVDIRTRGQRSADRLVSENPHFEPWPAFLSLHRHLVTSLWAPMSARGACGIKSGYGFYDSPGKGARRDVSPAFIDALEILAPAVNCAAWCVTNAVGSIEDLNRLFLLAFGWPKGIFDFIDDYGPDTLCAVLEEKRAAAPVAWRDFYLADRLLADWPRCDARNAVADVTMKVDSVQHVRGTPI
ncbi:hypothetical protein DSCO28_15340 [Desulfosarcina ovata subsp. sediminis]|uniref:3-hydroxyacyl-CoA dehydrogenase n=1 Tax=Desulfosarcina ovata subsp. sediminis TaxID=885957 RepID=A0A5K7ZFN1_9BACT|nr:3-hydroxyacyl-CoA dehydrogenase [Desulfosarcina ovata]BBO80968.1 hypothetical protein DSCO28_15340 [Desulfosarcina ovata subsp. sediminis]